jgi:hypothetical protein
MVRAILPALGGLRLLWWGSPDSGRRSEDRSCQEEVNCDCKQSQYQPTKALHIEQGRWDLSADEGDGKEDYREENE